MIYLVAGDIAQARIFAMNNNLGPEDYRYISSVRDIERVQPRPSDHLFFIGEFYKRPFSETDAIRQIFHHRKKCLNPPSAKKGT